MIDVLLDSVILIDHFNGIPAATAYLKNTEGFCAISVITRAEVLAGLDSVGVQLALPLIERFTTLEINAEIADRAAVLRRTHRWKLPDAFQAALAKHHNLKLVTRNTRDFPPNSFDFVVIPYEL